MRKAPAAIILSIVAVLGGVALNFEKFAWGGKADVKNLLITLVYIVLWVVALTLGAKSKSRGMLRYGFIFWILTLLFALFATYISATEIQAGWAIPFVTIFLGPWDGIRFWLPNIFIAFITIAFISLILVMADFVLLRRLRKD